MLKNIAWILAAVLLTGCRLGTGMRSEDANRLSPPPADLLQLPETYWEPPSWMAKPYRGPDLALPPGRRVLSDSVADDAHLVLVSDRSARSSGQQLLFVDGSARSREIPVPRTFRQPIGSAGLVSAQPPRMLLGELWAVPPGRGPSIDGVPLRTLILRAPSHGDLLLTDFEGHVLSRHRSAAWPTLAPDRSLVAFWRSDADALHNLYVTPLDESRPQFVCAVVEADPGSGISFEEAWSVDSRYLRIQGARVRWEPFRWIYDTQTRKLYEMPGPVHTFWTAVSPRAPLLLHPNAPARGG